MSGETGFHIVVMGYIALILGKPTWYSLILAFASKRLATFGPHWPPPHAENGSLVARAVFRRAPLKHVIVFAALAEIVSLVVDIPLLDASRFNIC